MIRFRAPRREFISLVLPARDAVGTLRLSVLSSLLALRQGDELLLVVDQNDEATFRLAHDFSDPRVRVLVAPIGSSFSDKLNLGVSRAVHPLIGRMDADDVCLPWRFLSLSRILEKKRVDFIFSTAIVFGRALRPLPVLPQLPIPLDDWEVKEQLCFTNPLVHPSVLMKREAFESLDGYSEKSGEDLDLWLRGAVKGLRFHRIGTPTILYRYSKKSLSRSTETKKSVENDRHIRHLREKLRTNLRPHSRPCSSASGEANSPSRIGSLSWKARLALLDLGLNS